MAHVTILPEHLPMLVHTQHILEYLRGEQMRLQAELALVVQQGQRAEAELRAFLLHTYGIAPGSAFTLDLEAHAITTPVDPDAPESVSEPEPAPDTDMAPAPDGD